MVGFRTEFVGLKESHFYILFRAFCKISTSLHVVRYVGDVRWDGEVLLREFASERASVCENVYENAREKFCEKRYPRTHV